MHFLGRKILIQHAYSNPIPFKKVETETTPSARQYLYDEQATHMLQLFDTSATTEGELHDYTTLAAARGYVQPEQQAAIANEQLLQNYMLQSQLFFTQPVATQNQMQQVAVAAAAAANVVPSGVVAAQPSSVMQTPTQPTQRRRTYNRAPRNHHVYEEEPEPPKKEVMCFSVEGNAQKAKQAKPTELDDIEEMLDTYFIVNDKNGTTQSSQASNNGMILGN